MRTRAGRAAALVAAVFVNAALAQFARAQSPMVLPPTAVEQLFASMRRADTAAIRAAFVPNARVIPIPADSTVERPSPLDVDAFVKFMANTASNPWDERMSNASTRIDVTLAQVWFDYVVRRGATISHCGVNSVQLQRTRDGWQIVSMAFTSRTTGCGSTP